MALRSVEKVSLLRLVAKEPGKLREWWVGWAAVVAGYPPSSVWNVDETGTFLGDVDKRTKVVTIRGDRAPRRAMAEQRQ